MKLLNEAENEAARQFMLDHYKRCKMSTAKVELTVEAGSGSGLYISVKCPKCKARSDITDYAHW